MEQAALSNAQLQYVPSTTEIAITGQALASPTIVCSMWSFVCMACMSDRTSWPAQLVTVTHTVNHICLLSCLIPSPPSSMSNYDSTLEWCWQMEREETAAETRHERATALHHLCVATSLVLAQLSAPNMIVMPCLIFVDTTASKHVNLITESNLIAATNAGKHLLAMMVLTC